MKIILDAYQYTDSITGTDRMAHNFLLELQNIDSTNQYYVICSQNDYIPETIHATNFRVIRPPSVLPIPGLSKLLRRIWRRTQFYSLITLKADVFFSFHNMRLPRRRIAKKMITSNLDLIPIVIDTYKEIMRASPARLKREYARVAHNADSIMSISSFSKKELCQTFEIDDNKVVVIPLAADPIFKPSPKTSDKKFILTIGGSEPRKNVKAVAAAYSSLPGQLKRAYPLMIAGGDWHGIQTKSLATDGNVHVLGFVPDAELVTLYNNATVFVFASSYEGFGFTILEAMASGAPVIAASGSSLEEVGSNAALYFDPNDTDSLADQLERLLGEPDLRKKLITKGFKQADKFSWHASTKQLHDLLTK